MTQVTIYSGRSELLIALSADIEARSIADYVRVYDQVVRALHAGDSIAVAVSDDTVRYWLQRLQERYAPERVQFKTMTHRQRLSELWRIQAPDWVTDDQIGRAKLLDVVIAAQPGRDFEDFVLEIFFSPFVAQPRLPLGRLGDLLKSYNPQQWAEAIQRPLVGDIFRRRMQTWVERAEQAGEKLLVQWLQESPEKLGRQLSIFKVLDGYPPEVGRRVMGDQFDVLARLDLDLSAIPISESHVEPALDQIRVHLEGLIRSNTPHEALKAILIQASGYLEIEFDVVQRLLRSGESQFVDRDIVQRVRNLFIHIRERPYLDQALADLDLLVSQPPPPQPDPDPTSPWNDDRWLEWAERHYLPYRFWLEEIGQLGDSVDLAHAYAEWLYKRYPAMRLSSPRMIYQALPALKGKMMDAEPVLVLVIDNLNAKFLSDLRRYMQAQGYYVQGLAYYVAMLPSCTEVSKKCLFTGQPDPFKGSGYEEIVQDTWTKALSGRRVRYLPHIGALRAIKRREHDVYFVNYLPLDMAFHQDEDQVGVSHAQAARGYLRAVARDVRAFGERIGAAHDLTIIVVSDHGSTRIPADAPNLIDPAFFAQRVLDKHHRYVRISDSELKQLPDNIQHQCYVFERGRFGLGENYLAAKAHYRFLPTTGSTYIHGGLTPEETLTPAVVFAPATVTPKPLTVRLLDNEFYYARKSEVRLEIVNTNAYPCEALRVEIQNPNVDAPGLQVGVLAPMSQEAVTIQGRFRRLRGDVERLHIRIEYDFLGQPQQQDVEQAVEMKAMMETAFDLRDLL